MKKSVFFVLAYTLCVTSANAAALGDQWYIGLGAGASWLQPNPRQVGVDIERRLGTGGNLFVGMDLDDRTSGQITFYALGNAELDNGRLVDFQAFDGSVLYRLYDTKDRRLSRSGMHLALYGRFALGFLNRDTSESLIDDSVVYFGAGGGAEWFITEAFSVRLEGMYLDKDAAHGSLQLVGRFGGRLAPSRPRLISLPDNSSAQATNPVRPGTTESTTTPAPSVSSVPDVPTVPPEAPSVPADLTEQDATDATEEAQVAQPREIAEPTVEEPIDSAEQLSPVESVELIESVEPPAPIQPSESAEPIEPAELVEQAELADLIAPVESTESSESTESTISETENLSQNADQDGDNVPDAEDQCLASPTGYPVRSNGCPLFDGLLNGVDFVDGSSALLPAATDQLDFLANVLIQYPKAKIEVHAHTINSGPVKEQTALTRARVRTIGAYLVRQGVKVDRLVLRSFGGSRPLSNSGSAQSNSGNNRIEVIEVRN